MPFRMSLLFNCNPAFIMMSPVFNDDIDDDVVDVYARRQKHDMADSGYGWANVQPLSVSEEWHSFTLS